jgi:Flp pilus assembly protein TadD
MTIGPIEVRERWTGTRAGAQMRSVIATVVAATIAVAAMGCAATPAPVAPNAAPPPSIAQSESKPPEAGQSRASDPRSEFHAKATDRQQFQVHIDFGRAFEAQGNLDAAIQEYHDALTVVENKRRGPFRPADEALAHRRMGSALDRMGRFAQAETHYKRALKLSPKDAKIWNDAGYSYYLQGRWADAEQALKTAARFAPDDERIRTNLGLTLAAAGRTDDALPLLSQSNGDAVGHANLGYLLAASGQTDLARRQYETALALRPDLEVAQRALARMDHKGLDGRSPGTTSALMARNLGSTTHEVDSSVNQATMAASEILPPLPSRILPEARAASVVNSPAASAPARIPDPVPFPPPPPL